MGSVRSWLRPPLDLMVLFSLVMLVPAATLLVLGLRLLDQDRALEKHRLAELRESTADQVVRALQQAITASEMHLANPSPWHPPEDAVRIAIHSGGIEAIPPGRLLYYPVLPEGREAPDEPFRQEEEYEYRLQDYQKAIALCRKLSSSSDAAIRVGALLRIARTLRKTGQQQAALDAYAQLGQISSVTVRGIPADLLARRARCTVLGELGRTAELRTEATALQADLNAGRWQLDRAWYIHFSEQTGGWLGFTNRPEPGQLALAEAVEWLWATWTQKPQEKPNQGGRQCVSSNGVTLVALWQSTPERMLALVAGSGYQQQHWFRELSGLRGFQLSLVSGEGQTVFGDTPAEGLPRVQRLASETGLPWTVRVAHADSHATLEEFASRRRMLLAGLGLLAILVTAGSYFIWRAMARELAAARLQSDFVSAVSHEFRTPLTSLRQFNDLLAEERNLPGEQRREFRAAQARATDRLQRLVESLLDFGRMEAGARPYRFERIDVGALVERVVGDFCREAESAEFDVRCSSVPAFVDADAEALARALWNLLDNAVKYSGDSRTIEVTMARQAGSIMIGVQDRGPGVPREEQKEIFRKFFRGAYARTQHIRGTGIGLAMVRHIVDAHGGRIELASAPGKGSTFAILLPVGD